MKMHLTVTIDENVLKEFRSNCKERAFCLSLIIEKMLQNFNEKVKNEGGTENASNNIPQ